MAGALVVIAKDPQPGQSKTRLCPPCTKTQAAALAAAALSDTLDVVMSVPARRHVLVLHGDGSRWRRPGLEILPQRPGIFADRLSGAFADVGEPALLVGMDTPQLAPELLGGGLAALSHHDAVLGPADDGGYWSVGLNAWHPEVFRDIPMSTAETHRHQTERFTELGFTVHTQPPLRDVDTFADAQLVAELAPRSRFARTLAAL